MRNRRSMSQEALAKASGITAASIRCFESQRALPSEETIVKFAAALNVRPESLFLYRFSSHEDALSGLIQLSGVYGFAPVLLDLCVGVAPTGEFMKQSVGTWAAVHQNWIRGSLDDDRYREWLYSFAADFDPADFPLRFELGEPVPNWEMLCLSRALKRLRTLRGMRQDDVSERAGLRVRTYQSYEAAVRLPKEKVIRPLADALEVKPHALRFYDFGTPVQAMHALFQMAMTYDLRPDIIDGEPVVRTASRGLEQEIVRWHEAREHLLESGDEDAFFLWRCCYKSTPTWYASHSRYVGELVDGDLVHTNELDAGEPRPGAFRRLLI